VERHEAQSCARHYPKSGERILDDREGEAVVKVNLSGVLYVVTVYLD